MRKTKLNLSSGGRNLLNSGIYAPAHKVYYELDKVVNITSNGTNNH